MTNKSSVPIPPTAGETACENGSAHRFAKGCTRFGGWPLRTCPDLSMGNAVISSRSLGFVLLSARCAGARRGSCASQAGRSAACPWCRRVVAPAPQGDCTERPATGPKMMRRPFPRCRQARAHWLAPGRTGSGPTSRSRALCGSCLAPVLRPDAGSDHRLGIRCFDHGGRLPDLRRLPRAAPSRGRKRSGWARSAWFPGGSGKRDLGMQLNNAFAWGFLQVDVPPAPDHAIRTTMKTLPWVDRTVHVAWLSPPRRLRDRRQAGLRGRSVESGIGASSAASSMEPTSTPRAVSYSARGTTRPAANAATRPPCRRSHVTGHWGVGVDRKHRSGGARVLELQSVDSRTGGHDLAASWRDGHDRQCRLLGASLRLRKTEPAAGILLGRGLPELRLAGRTSTAKAPSFFSRGRSRT